MSSFSVFAKPVAVWRWSLPFLSLQGIPRGREATAGACSPTSSSCPELGWSPSCEPLLAGRVEGSPSAHAALAVPTQHEALSEYRPVLAEAHGLQHHSSMADKKLVLIPLIFICLRVWSTVRFVLTLCGSPAVQTPVLVVLHVRGSALPDPWGSRHRSPQ